MSMEKAVRVSLVVLAVGYGAVNYRIAADTDDGGPPLGALCMATPAVVLLLVAGATWHLPRPVRRGPGTFCAQCGYNLTGNASGTCPECDAVVPARPNA